MKQVSDKEYERYLHCPTDPQCGGTPAPYGLPIIRAGFDRGPEKTGNPRPEMPAKSRHEGTVDPPFQVKEANECRRSITDQP